MQIDLPFGSSVSKSANPPISDNQTPRQILPCDGDTRYYGLCYNQMQADTYLAYFLNRIDWQHDEAIIYGKHYVTARKIAWYGDDHYAYKYSGKTRVALLWTQELLDIKHRVEDYSKATYNSCLLNLYEDGTQGMDWHHDDEKGLGKHCNIASVTFGAERRFDLRHKQSKEKVSILLEHGSLLVMAGTTQSCWQHQLPKSMKITQPRVNLTFRKMLV